MDSVKSFFDSFKEFIWDILGYLLPGSLFLIILSAIVKQQYYFSSSLITKESGMYAAVFVIVSYSIGYCVYGLGLIKELVRGKRSYTKKIESNITQNDNYKIAKQFITNELTAKGNPYNLSTSSLRDVRNIAMGFSPESDQKVYTFMFRSEISHHIANISIILGSVGWLVWILNHYKVDYFKRFMIFHTENRFLILYSCLILSYFILRQARNRFYAIAMGLPFSILISKLLNK